MAIIVHAASSIAAYNRNVVNNHILPSPFTAEAGGAVLRCSSKPCCTSVMQSADIRTAAACVMLQEYFARIMKKLKEVGASTDRTNFYV